ncbi:nucleotidyltransferase family protein [Endozoicomonas euniceicola]|uniref:Nucleotidyltransferase domain-containing protein n=1 Tax=Endozoicomonas euniceicola TaxID=1234143 RepID=A0ABY6GWS2_9GAMM|nr:nucleotidyltransferase domain-containing protein [Endozoicomonas euniceicola]UYM16429.1 nucleotidyltransferase domain-containing protein [Endozoicomonas euniceicola]
MKPSEALNEHRESIKKVVAEHRAANARVFGSVLTGCNTEESDLDLIVDPQAGMTLLDIGAIRHKLRKLLGVKVDVLTPLSLTETVRSEVLAKAEPL